MLQQVGGNKSLTNNLSSEKKSNIIGGFSSGIYHQNFVDDRNLASTSRGIKSAFTSNNLVKKEELFSSQNNKSLKGERESSLDNERNTCSKKLLPINNEITKGSKK